MITSRVLSLLITVAISYAQMAIAPGRGQVSVALKGEDGTGLNGARVSLQRKGLGSTRQRLPQQDIFRAVTSVDGAAILDFLPDGQFTICAAVPGPWLNPCEWGSERPLVIISGISSRVAANVVLKRGVSIMIEVADPQGLISQHEGKTRGAHLLLGIQNDAGMFTEAALVSENSGSRAYSIVIPFGARVNLVVASPFFRLTDSSGTAFGPAGGSLPLLVPSGQLPPTVRVAVNGRKM
jgi:hypothetical protein